MRDGELPVHPAVGTRTRAQIGGLELGGAIFRREIAHDRIGFPQQESVLLQRRHQAVRVHREICGLVVLAKRTANIDALVCRSSSPTVHMTFWTFTEVFRPQILIIAVPSVRSPVCRPAVLQTRQTRACAMAPMLLANAGNNFESWCTLAQCKNRSRCRRRQSSHRASSGSMIGMPPRMG